MTSEMREDGGGRKEEVAAQGPPPHTGGVTGETELRRVAGLVDSLISPSYSIKSFPGKWQSMRNKLEQLSSGLTTAAGTDLSNSGDNLVLTELLEAITSTVDEARELVHRCTDESYTGGKLLMRSNLDLAVSKLELHVKSLAGIYSSGILTHSHAIVASKPGAGARREDMRFYVQDLFSRLKIGDSEIRIRALTALNEILHEDDKYVRIVVVEKADITSLLVGFLEFGDRGVREEATEAVSVIAGFDSYRGALVAAGAVAPLIRVLEIGSELGKERAARALKKLTENSDNAWSVSAHGGVTVLLKICGGVDSGGELIGSACGVLRSLAGVGEIRRFMVEAGVVPVILKLLRSKEEASQIHAMEFLQVAASGDDDVKIRVIRDGGIESIVRVLDPNSSYSSKAREIAFRVIEEFCSSPTISTNHLMGAGFLDRILFFLRNGEVSVQESALKAASRLCAASEETKKAMGEAGFMPEFVRLLEAKSFEVREMAAEILSSMVTVHRNQRKLIQEEHNVSLILQLLNPEAEKTVTKKFLLSALMSISDTNSGRRKIAASGYVTHLEKLAETDVMDAKRVVKKMSANRFRSILNRIWSS